jgi:hypothetical protein
VLRAAAFVKTGDQESSLGIARVQLAPMVEQLQERYGAKPREMLGDGGFANQDDIEPLHADRVEVYAPVKDEQKKRDAGIDPFAPRKGDNEGVAAWRQRMGTEAAKAIYAERA